MCKMLFLTKQMISLTSNNTASTQVVTTISYKMFETNSSFHVKQRTKREVFFQTFFASIGKIFILAGAMGTRISFYEV